MFRDQQQITILKLCSHEFIGYDKSTLNFIKQRKPKPKVHFSDAVKFHLYFLSKLCNISWRLYYDQKKRQYLAHNEV